MPITRFVVSLVVLSAFPVIATAQSDNPTATVPPTIADVQKVVQTINGDKIKLRAYCDIGKLQDQIRSAQEKNDTKTIDSLDAKIGSLEGIEKPVGDPHGGTRRHRFTRAAERRSGWQCGPRRPSRWTLGCLD